MKPSKRKISQAVVLAISAIGASAAMAAGPVIQGGGSSLVAPSIGSEFGTFGTSEGTFVYHSVNSGGGQNGFLGDNLSTLSFTSGTIDFGNSDAALTADQVSSYTLSGGLGATQGPLIQLPYIVTPITIPITNAPAVTSTSTPQTTPGQAHSIALNDNDLCGIFSGSITNWNQVINPDTSTVYTTASLPITVVYRSDGSGTTELTTRHLAKVCTTSNTHAGVTFKDSTSFTDSFPSGFPTGTSFVGGSGSSGVRTAITSQTSLGRSVVAYLSPDYANTFLAPSSTSASPDLQVASLRNLNGANVAPTHANATTALGTLAIPTNDTDPVTSLDNPHNPVAWDPVDNNPAAAPSAGYPISGTSQIILSQCYQNASLATAVRDFLTDHYTNATYKTILNNNGFDLVPTTFAQALVNDFISPPATTTFALNIENATVCTTGKGR